MEKHNFIVKLLTDRLFLAFVIICISFYLLVVRLFSLQIVKGENYQNSLEFTTFKKINITAPRGTIYDRYGRPLAVNRPTFTVKIDPNLIAGKDINDVLYNLILLFEKYNDDYVEDFPITAEQPYEFLFDNNKKREEYWKRDMQVPQEKTAPETIEFLKEKFELSKNLSETHARQLLALRSQLYMYRYRKEDHITVAYDVKKETMIAIEEHNPSFPGIYIDTDFLREYPEGQYFSHILGFVRGLNTDEELEEFGEGYEYNDIVGKSGIEKTFEKQLAGIKGQRTVEVVTLDKKMSTVNIEEPIPGSKIFLTLDQRLQKRSFEIIEEVLANVLIKKLQASAISQKDLFISMVKCNTINTKDIMNSDSGSSVIVKDWVLRTMPNANVGEQKSLEEVKQKIADGIESGDISLKTLTFICHEQGLTTHTYEEVNRFTPLQYVISGLSRLEITPAMTGLDPSTASLVVEDVTNGDVLAAVSYPSFDNNRFVNNFDNEYYRNLNTNPTSPLINRPFSEPRAPGSTFKIISAVAALENGSITPRSTIHDGLAFDKAGKPVTRCWSRSSHGTINVSKAISVSCNYFFCEAVYRLGNAKSGNQLDSINKLNEYMKYFGLNDPTGVEIGERNKNKIDGIDMISSPSYKEYLVKLRNPDAKAIDFRWADVDTIHTSMGQSVNNYTSANMVKYFATLATRGERYQMHLLNRTETQTKEGLETTDFEPKLELTVPMSESTINAVYEGMIGVTTASYGTAKSAFRDFPITVAGKTGTAQENKKRNDHASFGGFAPFENPRIAVYVSVPFGDYKYTIPASHIAKKVIAEYFGLENETPEAIPMNSLY